MRNPSLRIMKEMSLKFGKQPKSQFIRYSTELWTMVVRREKPVRKFCSLYTFRIVLKCFITFLYKEWYFHFKKCHLILEFPLSASASLYLNWYKAAHFFCLILCSSDSKKALLIKWRLFARQEGINIWCVMI